MVEITLTNPSGGRPMHRLSVKSSTAASFQLGTNHFSLGEVLDEVTGLI